MKVLVIGASGMLAKPVIKHLDNAGFQLRLFSRTVSQTMFEKEYEIVRGDVYNLFHLDKAMIGCDAVHISITTINDAIATKAIIEIARQREIKLISAITGCTVSEENRWFPMIENKYEEEKYIINSGISYMIFRPTWFFESLDLMIRDGKAMVLGKQPNPCHWVAADDYGKMVANAYIKTDTKNKIFFVFGPEQYLMKDLLEKYCKHHFPEIKKVSTIPLWMVRMIAILTGNKEMKNAASLFAYFEKVKELGDPDETNILLGKPEITFEQWINSKSQTGEGDVFNLRKSA
jgi:uncharacterized protein YbjT (DUF2867 family)